MLNKTFLLTKVFFVDKILIYAFEVDSLKFINHLVFTFEKLQIQRITDDMTAGWIKYE